VLHVDVEDVLGAVEGARKALRLSYSCIHCHGVLGVEIDPRAKARRRPARSASG
jgi:hypothetical protein